MNIFSRSRRAALRAVFMAGCMLSLGFHGICGKVDTIRIYSQAMHKSIPALVILPDSRTDESQRFPVLYLLHGYSDTYSTYIHKIPALKSYVDEYQMIIVCPDGGFSSWYLDSPIDSSFRYETYITKELLPYIDSHFNTLPGRRYRGITGHSMGGHGAFYLAIRHPNLFGAIGSMSGGVDFRPFPENWDLKKRLGDYASHRALWDTHVVIYLADSLKKGEFHISFECGSSDFFIHVNRALHRKLLEMGIDHDYTERPGAHTWNYWRNAVPYQLLFFFRYFTGQDGAQAKQQPM